MTDILQKKFKDNYLISSMEIGKSRPIGYQVPDRIFGKQSYFPNRQGAKEVINDWQVASKTERSKKIQNYVEMNILGAKKGVSSLKAIIFNNKEVHDFRTKNPICKSTREGSQNLSYQIPDVDFTYGKPNWEDQQIKKVIEYQYRKEADLELIKLYNNQESKQEKEWHRKQQQAHLGKYLKEQIQKQQEEVKQPFKMRKFQNVDSRYKSQSYQIDWQDVLNQSK